MQDVQPVDGRVLLKCLTHHQQQQHQHQHQQQQGHHLLLQPQQQQQQRQQQQQQQQQPALKCPRCDSLNTKFCYYNNYNLSQPRHFCKNCRRYWTKGGVLRNVPVGGGCRKSKRSSSSSVTSKHKSSSSSKKNNNNIIIQNNNNSTNSSSESSSTNTAVGGGALFQIPEVENYGMSSDLVDSTTSNVFSGEIGGFMNLISNNNKNNDNTFGVLVNDDGIGNGNVSAVAAASFTEFLQNQGVQDWDMGKICGVHPSEEKIGGTTSIDLLDPTVRFEDFLQNRPSTVGLTSLDWLQTPGNNNNNNNNQGLFDVPDNSSVDHQAYWSQSTSAAHHDSQWSDSTTSHLPLFLP